MALFLKKSAIVFLLFVPFHITFIMLWGEVLPQGLQKNLLYFPGGYGALYTRLKEAKTIGNVDVVVLGSSHAYRGIDPRVFAKEEIQLFNLGSSAQTPIQGEYLFEKYGMPLKPKLLLIEVFPSTLASDGVESALDVIGNSVPNLALFEMALKSWNVKPYVTFIYALYKNNTTGFTNLAEPVKKQEDTYVAGGFVEREYQEYPGAPYAFVPNDIVLEEKQMKAFEKIIACARKADIAVMLVMAPVSRDQLESVANREALDGYFRKIPGTVYINYNDSLHLENHFFYDPHHLNQKGVETFNAQLLKDIKQLFAIDQEAK